MFGVLSSTKTNKWKRKLPNDSGEGGDVFPERALIFAPPSSILGAEWKKLNREYMSKSYSCGIISYLSTFSESKKVSHHYRSSSNPRA